MAYFGVFTTNFGVKSFGKEPRGCIGFCVERNTIIIPSLPPNGGGGGKYTAMLDLQSG